MATYEISGTGIRGYFETCKHWSPKRYEILKCIINQQGGVTVTKGKIRCGSVQTELQEVSRKFIQNGGTIKAKVTKIEPRFRCKGQEILCKYIWSGLKNEFLKAVVEEAKKAVAEIRRKYNDKEIKLRKIQNNKKKNPSNCTSSTVNIDEKMLKKKKASTHVNSSAGKSGISKGSQSSTATPSNHQNQLTNTEKIPLSSKNFVKLAQFINKNWQLLAIELGLSKTQLWQIKENHRDSVELQIYHMFEKWSEIEPDRAYLHILEKSMADCPKVCYQQPEMDNYIQKIRQDYNNRLNV